MTLPVFIYIVSTYMVLIKMKSMDMNIIKSILTFKRTEKIKKFFIDIKNVIMVFLLNEYLHVSDSF